MHRNNPRWSKVIGKKIGRTASAVEQKAIDLKLYRRPDGENAYNLTHLARMFHKDVEVVLKWIRMGHFNNVVKIPPHKQRGYYCITLDELWEWMEQPLSWHLWEPDLLEDEFWRNHFTELRKGWINAYEAAEILCLTKDYVSRLRKNGRIPGISGKHWSWYRVEDVLQYNQQRNAS